MRTSRYWIAAATTAAMLALAGSVTLAAPVKSQVLLKSPVYGNIPKVTLRGVKSGVAPWVAAGNATLTRTHLSVSGTWLLIPPGIMASGAPVPKTLVGTTAGVKSVVAVVTDAEGARVVTKPTPLSKAGTFTFNVPVHLKGPVNDPIVLIGPPGKAPHSILAWFAATDFLKQYGTATPQMVRAWSAGAKKTHKGSGGYGSKSGGSTSKGGGSTSSGSGW